MRMIEANLYPAIPHLHVQQHDREVTSMSDYVHTGRRSKMLTEHRTIEYRLMFGACYLLCLAGAIITRLMPWRKRAASDQGRIRGSIFREASSAASVWVASSFMGL
ncbi:MAG TPA: hypothetical protein VIT22_10235 [Pseudoxanthomonas sp.]